jgi:hypothetical protein
MHVWMYAYVHARYWEGSGRPPQAVRAGPPLDFRACKQHVERCFPPTYNLFLVQTQVISIARFIAT